MTPSEWETYITQMGNMMEVAQESAQTAQQAVQQIQSLSFYLDPDTGDLYYEMD